MTKFLLLFFIPQIAIGSNFDNQFIRQQIKSFYANPDKFYNTPIGGKKTSSAVEVNQVDRLKYRNEIIKNELKRERKSIIHNNDRASSLLRDIHIEDNIIELDKLNIRTGQTKAAPWSDYYWPIFKGGLGARYAVKEFEYIYSWKEGLDYIQSHPAGEIFNTGMTTEINKLSPSEKFDFLLGSKMNLSNKLWGQGRRYAERSPTGDVETWMGICHGWAAASYIVPRPNKSIKVMAFDGVTPITFYPSDLKALVSLLWASTKYSTNFIGGRCRSSNPTRDRSGRITDKNCADNNPGTFFLSVLNGVGVHGKSFIMDVTHSYEVWNQPIRSYKYTLFNPKTQELVENQNAGLVELSTFKDDPYKRYRSRNAKYILGVSMEVVYGVETSPIQLDVDNVELDENDTLFLLFDLELDKNFKIIGGEWYNKEFPDFLWKPSEDSNAYTDQDLYVLSRPYWDGEKSIQPDIVDLAIAAAKEGSPMAYIVNSLIKLAQ